MWPRSPFSGPQTAENVRGTFGSSGQNKRFRQVIEIRYGGVDFSQRTQSFQRTSLGRGRKDSDWPSAICDLNGLAFFDAAQQLAGPLSKLTDTDRRHVLPIAQRFRELHGHRVQSRRTSRTKHQALSTQHSAPVGCTRRAETRHLSVLAIPLAVESQAFQ